MLEQRQMGLKILKEEWFKQAVFAPRKQFGTIAVKEDSEKVLKAEIQKFKDYIEEIFNLLNFLNGKSEILAQVDRIARRLEAVYRKNCWFP